ncbi:hypothetical protein KKF84_02840 [Myxococcota bacterium]|nr:hypothetical protein [Myxococcota bacterium]
MSNNSDFGNSNSTVDSVLVTFGLLTFRDLFDFTPPRESDSLPLNRVFFPAASLSLHGRVAMIRKRSPREEHNKCVYASIQARAV